MTFMALNGLSQCTCDVQKVAKGCDVGDIESVRNNATTLLAVNMGVEKYVG